MFLYSMDLPPDMPGVDDHRRVSVVRCKPCANPNDSNNGMPQYFSAGLTQNVLNNVTKESPLHTTSLRATPLRRLIVKKIAGHQSGRRRDVAIAVMHETLLVGLSRKSWERAMDLQLFPPRSCSFGPPNQRRYRRIRIGAAQM